MCIKVDIAVPDKGNTCQVVMVGGIKTADLLLECSTSLTRGRLLETIEQLNQLVVVGGSHTEAIQKRKVL